MAINCLFFHLLILASIFAICRSDDVECAYVVYVKTGSIPLEGMGAEVSLSLYDASRGGIIIHNLVSWGGHMGLGHKYFQAGKIDIFTGQGSCLSEHICKMNLTLISNKKETPSVWFCDYVDVTTARLKKNCTHVHFNVDELLVSSINPTVIKVRDICLVDGKKPMMHDSNLPLVSVV